MTENKSNVEPQTYLLVRKWLIAKKALCDSSQRGTDFQSGWIINRSEVQLDNSPEKLK